MQTRMEAYREVTLASKDGYELALRVYDTAKPKAVVKVIHGMEEHQGRYRAFAEYLQADGYAVVTADLRGHGETAPTLSHIAGRDGHLRLLEDEQVILDYIHERWPGVPVDLFAHSMGTIIARAFLQTQSREYHRVVLSGYPNPNSAAGAGIMLTDVLSAFKGGSKKSGMVDNMVLGPFSKAFPGAKSPLEWLSRNPENVKRYAEDRLCGVPFTLGSYNALFHLIKMMDTPSQYREVWKLLPILMISGKDDPCTGGEKGRADSLNRLKEAGFREIRVETIDGMRHEILNETENRTVYRTILDFLNEIA